MSKIIVTCTHKLVVKFSLKDLPILSTTIIKHACFFYTLYICLKPCSFLVCKTTNVQIRHAQPIHSLQLELESGSYPLGSEYRIDTFHHDIIIGEGDQRCALFRISLKFVIATVSSKKHVFCFWPAVRWLVGAMIQELTG